MCEDVCIDDSGCKRMTYHSLGIGRVEDGSFLSYHSFRKGRVVDDSFLTSPYVGSYVGQPTILRIGGRREADIL